MPEQKGKDNVPKEVKKDNSSFGKGMRLVKGVLKDPIQVIFLIFGIIAMLGIGPFLYHCLIYRAKCFKEKRDDQDFPALSELKWSLMSFVFFLTLDLITHPFLVEWFKPLCKEQKDLVAQERRSIKAATAFYKIFYYTGISIWGYNIVVHRHFFPKSLGGSGDLYLSYTNYPFQTWEGRQQVSYFILLQLGYHHAELVRLIFFSKKTKDVVEMSTHEVLTIAMYGTCYLINIHEIGAVVSLLHDASDILIMVTKFLTESRYGDLAAVFFVTECFIWLYTRMIVFPWCAYVVAFQPIDYGAGDWIILPFFGFCLYCLVFMHYYWFYMFMQILYYFATKGETEDKIADDLESDDDEPSQSTGKERAKKKN